MSTGDESTDNSSRCDWSISLKNRRAVSALSIRLVPHRNEQMGWVDDDMETRWRDINGR